MTLLSLPNELLLDVFSHFEDPHLLFTLSTLCKRLHLLALPLYLSQIGVYESLSPGVCNITIGQHRTEALAALQTALFLDAVQTLSCTLPHAMQLGQDVKRLARVCAALTSVNSATLHVNPRKFLDDSSGDLNPLSFVDCLNSLLEKSCSSLTVKSFRDRWTDHKSRPMRRAQQPSRVLSAAALSPAAMRAKSLSTFNIHSEILVFPHVRAWTIDVLNSFPIRALSISAPFQIEEITDILAVTEIPTLLTLALHESRITPAQLHAFLARHPQITHLRLEKLIVPPLHERLPSRALESIVTLTAGPTHVAYLLHALNRLPSTLQCIRILSYMTTVDLQGANSSLHHVVSFLAGIPDLRLVLPVPDSLPPHCARHRPLLPRCRVGIAFRLQAGAWLSRMHHPDPAAQVAGLHREVV
ncbi:F-box domain-containing protein [Mycena indigotica]|uniref:F-box domain-containing protein n=1 Tax=Mycena indigotica TaxID=2126181 RepID=A0A8H6WIM1_9AGAR|nr:F-box domain-containing protein [Mycena indigotica]KAF7316278.1 F-box domain-containing protein [Mycena indigotica]